jgi:hypothetical protein
MTSPPPRTGWEPDTPVADTLLRQAVFNLAASTQIPTTLMGGRSLRRDDLVAADLGRPAGFFNSAILLRPLTEDRAAEVMDALWAFFSAENGTGEVLLWSAWPTPDLDPYGWELEGHPPLMLRPQGGKAPAPPPDLTIEVVNDRATLETYEQTVVRGFPLPELQGASPGTAFGEALLADDRLRFWLGRSNGEPVATGFAVLDSGLNGVSLIVTVPEARGHGYGEALTWLATTVDPNLPAVLLASDLGRPVYERMGFLPITRFTLWHRLRPSNQPNASSWKPHLS